ncbi:MAG TPA: hypothetical protein VGB25_04605 [Candidatus Binatia bacterium]
MKKRLLQSSVLLALVVAAVTAGALLYSKAAPADPIVTVYKVPT